MYKTFYLSIILFFSFNHIYFSQSIEITGVVYDQTGLPLPGAFISALNSPTKVTTDYDGNFKINVPYTTTTLEFSYVGFMNLEYKLKPNEHYVEVKLGVSYYDNLLFTVGLNADVNNPLFGINFSNGFEDIPLIHFEDNNSNILYFGRFQTDFEKDNTLDLRIRIQGTKLFFRTSLTYQQKDLKSFDFFYRNIELSRQLHFDAVPLFFIPSIGFQELNNYESIGIKLGVMKRFDSFYFGASSGYYINYFTYSGYFQTYLFNTNLSFRAEYEKLYKKDFFTVGIHYSFKLKRDYKY